MKLGHVLLRWTDQYEPHVMWHLYTATGEFARKNAIRSWCESPHDMAAGNSLSEMISFPYLKFSYRSILFVETWLCGGLSSNVVSIEQLLPLEWIQRNKCRFLTFDRNIHMVSSNVFPQSIDWILCESTLGWNISWWLSSGCNLRGPVARSARCSLFTGSIYLLNFGRNFRLVNS